MAKSAYGMRRLNRSVHKAGVGDDGRVYGIGTEAGRDLGDSFLQERPSVFTNPAFAETL